jgi:hypothetical protein
MKTAIGTTILAVASLLFTIQSTPQTPDSRLDKRVHLSLGVTTLDKVAAEISRQTGLTVEAADCLKERRLIAAMGDLTARQTLDALAALNGWTWRESEPGKYLIARHTIRRPNSVAEVPRTMRAALPKDIRIYLGLDTLDNKTLDDRFQASITHDPENAVGEAHKNLLASIRPAIVEGKPLPFAKLDRETREHLLFWLVFRRFGDTEAVLYDRSSPHLIEPARATLKLDHEKVLMIEMFLRPDYPVGFGANVYR